MHSVKAVLAGVAGVALFAVSAAAPAQTQATGQPASVAKEKDPNRVICQKVEQIGSRLTAKRVCMTSQQWDEQRRQDREMLEDSQRHRVEPASG